MTPEYNRIIGDNIRYIREKRSISYEQLSEKTELTPEEIKELENGQTAVTYRQLKQFSHFLKISRASFLQGLPYLPESLEEIEQKLIRYTRLVMKTNRTTPDLLWQILDLATDTTIFTNPEK